MKASLLSLLIIALLCDSGFTKEPMPGGKSPVAVTKPEVVAAANFAIKEEEKAMQTSKETPAAKLELVSILGAEEQVVAGMNYRLKLKVKVDGRERNVEATVWWQAWNKKAPYRLTSWNWQ